MDLTPAQREALNTSTELFKRKNSYPNFSIDSYINKWRAFTNEIEQGYQLTIYDYTNDLSARDVIQEFISSLSSDLQKTIIANLETADSNFKSLTRESKVTLSETSDSQWWWHRVPKRLEGELAEDIKLLEKRG